MDMLQLCRTAIDTFGEDAQVDMMIEEMSELTKALCKYKRGKTCSTFEHVIEEMADVYIMMAQMEMIFELPPVYKDGILQRPLSIEMDEKLERLAKKIRETQEDPS